MAYTVIRRGAPDGNDYTIVIDDGTINNDTSLKLVGRDYFGYGEAIAQDLVDLLENFASADTDPTSDDYGPARPTEGQIWYNNSKKSFQYYTGTNWLPMAAHLKSVIVKDGNNNDHSVTIAYELDSAETEIVVCAFSSEAITSVHANDPLNGVFPNDNIGKGITMAIGMKLHGTATSAQYADLAELYASDAEYQPGTVLKIGGEAEVTQTTDALCMDVFGVVSSEPAYLMNSAMEGMTVPVALEGRVPVRVIGEVKKGQRLVASETPGVARGVTQFEHAEGDDWFRMVGRALEDKTTLGEGLVVAVVGAK